MARLCSGFPRPRLFERRRSTISFTTADNCRCASGCWTSPCRRFTARARMRTRCGQRREPDDRAMASRRTSARPGPAGHPGAAHAELSDFPVFSAESEAAPSSGPLPGSSVPHRGGRESHAWDLRDRLFFSIQVRQALIARLPDVCWAPNRAPLCALRSSVIFEYGGLIP